MGTTQATFGRVNVTEHNGRHNCRKVHTVDNGKRIYCGNNASYQITRFSGGEKDVTYRCGMHMGEFKSIIKSVMGESE